MHLDMHELSIETEIQITCNCSTLKMMSDAGALHLIFSSEEMVQFEYTTYTIL